MPYQLEGIIFFFDFKDVLDFLLLVLMTQKFGVISAQFFNLTLCRCAYAKKHLSLCFKCIKLLLQKTLLQL